MQYIGSSVVDIISCELYVDTLFVADCRLANQMRMLNYSQWMQLVTTLFSNLQIIFGRVRVTVSLVMFLLKVSM